MSTSSSLLLQINDDYLTCQICMELYQSPKVLACLHSFCKQCLENCDKSEHESFIHCPLCRQSTTLGMKGIEGLKNNFVLSNMISMMVEWRKAHSKDDAIEDASMCQTCPSNESVLATFQCIDCLDQLCADCAAFHSRTKLTRDHESGSTGYVVVSKIKQKIVSLEDVENGKYKEKIYHQEMSRCKKHKNFKAEHFCKDCDTVICKECIIETHHGHSLSPIDETLQKVKKEVESNQEKTKANMESSQEYFDDLMKIEDDQKNQLVKVEREINDLTDDIIEAIKQKRTELLEYVEKKQNEKFTQIAFLKDHFDSQIKCMKNCIQLSECLTQSGTANELLLLKKNMEETMKELQNATKKVGETCSDMNSICETIRFVVDDDISSSVKLGAIEENRDENIATVIDNKILKHFEKIENSSSQKDVGLQDNNAAEPCCSTEKHTKEYAEDLYVNITQEPKKPMPTPRARPRKSRSTLDLTATKHLSLYMDDTDFTTSDKLQFYEFSTHELRSANKGLRSDEITNGSPAKPAKRNNYYPTAPHRRKLHSVTTPINELNNKPSYDNTRRKTIQSPSYRVAPAPPPKLRPNKKPPIPSALKPKYQSPKKAPAPLPPTVTANAGMLKAEILKIFEVSQRNGGSKDFYASLQGVVMTTNNIAILDSDGQQIILFNTDGFYVNRFRVHIPNQEKIKPTGLSISVSGNIYVLYPNVVTVWTTDGMLLSVFGHQHLIDAHGIAVDSKERIIVSDEGKQNIVVFNNRGNFVTNLKSQLQCPRFICTTTRDEIVVSDHQSNLVNIFDENGHFLTSCDAKSERKLKYPRGVTTIWPQKGQAELLLIADQGNNRVSAYNLHGKFLYHVLELSNDNGLKNPNHIAVLDNKKLVVLQNSSLQTRLYNLKATLPA